MVTPESDVWDRERRLFRGEKIYSVATSRLVTTH